jgi:hypothetical protein
MTLYELLESDKGTILLSVIFGIGIATIFRKECLNNNCVIITSPTSTEMQRYQYKIGEKCYEFKKKTVKC